MTDHYRNRLKHAAWTWLEGKFCRFVSCTRTKDRASGRNDKRAARTEEKRERE